MELIESKKAQEAAAGRSLWEIIGWAIGAALLIFVFLWYSGLGNKIMSYVGSYL